MFRILIRDPIACLDYERKASGHSQAVRMARVANRGGMLTTVLNETTGNVVIFLGEDLTSPNAEFKPT
jgi:hypothetical protein